MLTVLAEGLGTISACAYGVRGKKSKMRAAVQPFTCADFVFSRKGGDIYRVESAEIVDSFYPICEDIVKLSLANYLCDLSLEACQGDGDRVLSLLLNTMYVLAYRDISPRLAKAVFELKLAQYSGYSPCMDSCIECGKNEVLVAFDTAGGMKCSSCRRAGDVEVDGGLYKAMRYITEAESGKIFSFTASAKVEKELADISERYILSKSERSYKALDYLKKIM